MFSGHDYHLFWFTYKVKKEKGAFSDLSGLRLEGGRGRKCEYVWERHFQKLN